MIEQLLSRTDEWIIGAGLMVLFLAAAEVGYRGARRFGFGSDEASRTQVVTIEAAVLGLLALLLGFTFSAASSRFDARRQLVVDEANAIGTAYLRAQFLPEPQRSKVLGLLRRYVDSRLDFYDASRDPDKLHEVNARTDLLQTELWSEALAAGEKDSPPVTTGLFIMALNEVIDLHAKQLAAVRNRIPLPVFLLLCFVAVVAVGLTGCGSGSGGRRNFMLTLVMSLLIVAVTVLLIDLHRPTRGMVTVSQQSMIDLRDSIDRAAR